MARGYELTAAEKRHSAFVAARLLEDCGLTRDDVVRITSGLEPSKLAFMEIRPRPKRRGRPIRGLQYA